VPELPEVEALAAFLRERAVGRVVASVEVGAISVLKTFDPPPSALHGLTVTGVTRHGKFLDLDVDGLHLVVHLARAGWLRWSDGLSPTPIRPGKGPIALRVRLAGDPADDPDAGAGDAGAASGAGPLGRSRPEQRLPGFDLTEQGTQKRLAVSVVRSPAEVPGVARLGPDPLAEGFGRGALAAILTGSRQQIKGLLRDQSILAGVGNAYSDEVLHAARLSPFAIASSLDDEEVDRLYTALRDVLSGAVTAASGRPAKELKDAKRGGMRVHGRAGLPCPVCGQTVREVSFADSALQYCPGCQTGGRVLADRRMSRLLR